MNETQKKPMNTNLQANVQEANKEIINSNYIIKSHELIQQEFKVYLLAQGANAPYKGSRGHLDATGDVRELTDMFNKYGANSNIGISLENRNMVVLDIDRHTANKNGLQTLKQLGIKTNFDNDVIETTPRNGIHVFYRVPDGIDVKTFKRNLGAGLELVTDKITVAPSVKVVNGEEVPYKHFGKEFSQANPMPDWLIKLASKFDKSVESKKSWKTPNYSIDQRINMLLNGFNTGERNNQIMSFSGWLLGIRGVDPNLIYELVQKINSESDSPLPDKEVNTIFRSAYNREKKRASMGGY